jgi:hypothetical protein
MQGIVGVCSWRVFPMENASRPFGGENGLTGLRMTGRTPALVGDPRLVRLARGENESSVDL